MAPLPRVVVGGVVNSDVVSCGCKAEVHSGCHGQHGGAGRGGRPFPDTSGKYLKYLGTYATSAVRYYLISLGANLT